MVMVAAACEDDKPVQGEAPPPTVESKPGLCAGGGGTVKDGVSAGMFPRAVGAYCIDPNGETRAYGANAKGSLGQVCTELFDGECEVYRSFGLERVVTVRYVDGSGTPGAVNVNLSRFASPNGAYGFFTKRIVADADPAESAPKPLEAGGAAGLGTGIAYIWRGKHVVELSYTNEMESPDQIRASSARVIPELAREIGERVPGDKRLPAAARVLPQEGRIPLGVAFQAGDALDISGVGPGAVGYYEKGGQRWRVLSVLSEDEAAAKDVMKTLRKVPGARAIKEPKPALWLALRRDETGPPQNWLIERRENRIVGIGDEPFAGPTGGDAGAAELSEAERFALLALAFSAKPDPEPTKKNPAAP